MFARLFGGWGGGFGGGSAMKQSAPQQQMMSKEKSASFDRGVLCGMKSGAQAMAQMNKQMDIDDLEDLMDDMQDMQELEERQEFFGRNHEQEDDLDELADELDELEALGCDSEALGAMMAAPVPSQMAVSAPQMSQMQNDAE